MSRVDELSLGLVQCTINLVNGLTRNPLKAEIEGAHNLDSVCIRKLTCAYYGILDSYAQLAYNVQGVSYSEDEQQSIMYALVFLLKHYAKIQDDTAKEATWLLFEDLKSVGYQQIRQEWGQRARDGILKNDSTMAQLRAFAREVASGRKINPSAYENAFTIRPGFFD